MTCSGLFNFSTHLSRSDVRFHDKTNDREAFLNLRVKASKTDPFGSSTTFTIGSTFGIICPVRALKTYLSRTSTDHAGPLFCYSNGTPLSRSQFTKELRALLAQGAGINIADYAGHSFRIGAATTAASKGLPHWLIQTLGRWSVVLVRRLHRKSTHGACFCHAAWTPRGIVTLFFRVPHPPAFTNPP